MEVLDVILIHVHSMKKGIKIVIIVGIVLVIIITVILILVLKKNPDYPKEPISQSSLGISNENITLNISNLESSERPLLGVSNEVILDQVTTFVKTINPSLKQSIVEQGEFYNWKYKNQYVSYDLTQNILEFSVPSGISWDEASITGDSFTRFVKKYFNKDWTYALSSSGDGTYYANRTFSGQKIVTTDYREQTDTLGYKDGKITYGRILLTEFFDSKVTLPLMSESKLKQYINVKNYPKEIYPIFSSLQDNVLKEVNYLSDDFETIVNTLNNCKGASAEIVYLYKRLTQETLTPVYKMDLTCDITYKNQIYSVPATAYVSAIEPEYVLASE